MSTAKLSGKDFAQSLLDRALEAGADDAQVMIEEKEYFEIESAHDGIYLIRTNIDDSAALTIFREGRKGETSLNGRVNADVDEMISLAMKAAAGGMQDEANQVAEVPSGQPSTHGPAIPDKEIMIDAMLTYLDEAASTFPTVRAQQNNVTFTLAKQYFINSKGVQQEEQRGFYGFQTLFGGQDEDKITSFNYAGTYSFEPMESLLDEGVTRRVLDEASRSFDPKPVPEKFVGDVIITPECVSSMMPMLTGGFIGGALSGYSLISKTSPYADKVGEQIASRSFTLRNEPRSKELPRSGDFDPFGVPTRDIDIIKDGVLENFVIDFYISKKLDMPQTAGVVATTVAPGDQSIADIIARTGRGIILSRFSGGVPNAQLDFSGVAKNSFYVEDGVVQYPLIETMVSGNMQELLMNIHAISKETVNFGDGIYPYIAASGITISSK
jgi:PmbA protein